MFVCWGHSDRLRVCAKQAVCAELDICSLCVCNCVYGLIPTKPEDVCLTLIQSQRLLGVSASTICVCMYFCKCTYVTFLARGTLSLPRAEAGFNKVTLLNLSGKGRGVK